ncbi:hypothetical protein [Methylotuvimicrobium buryatense]|uniref:Uncharacterized protein n=1 Tax=Methylotuvimicrobium buryatense TaxID=95641 RepID=A0A4P9ULM1_METBY|nr:hypothetical protein [Methylotuvimicrobium buryatense]QCW81420.1 hypothetical protein EQU24_03520 [Methylotuvimicrobium buryatense]
MKKIVFIALAASMLVACSEKTEYEQAVLEDMRQEKDVKDYKLSPETMARCVVDLSSHNMPGVLAFDPNRRAAYRSYTKMLTLSKAENPEEVLNELRNEFGSPKDLADAHANYTESMMNCFASLIMTTEEEAKEAKEAE